MDLEKAKELPGPLKKFYKGEHLALGITQILVGILTIMFAIVINVDREDYYLTYEYVFMPHWTGVLFIISGSLSVAAARNPKPSLMKGMLGMNTVSAVAAGIETIYFSFELGPSSWGVHYLCSSSYHSYQSDVDPLCYENRIIPYYIKVGILSILLLFNILEFCITISNATFGCKTLCRNTYTETVVVVYQNTPPGNTDSLPAASKNVENP